MILARIFFLLVMCFSVGIVAYLLWEKLIHPLLFKEDMSNKLEEAEEDFVESQIDEVADKLRKGERLTDNEGEKE